MDSQHFSKGEDQAFKSIDWSTVNNSKTNEAPKGSAKNIIFLGDSRTEGIRDDVQSDATFICKTGEGYDWMKNNAFQQANSQVGMGTKVIIWFGVNDIDNQNNYIPTVNAKAAEWKARGAQIYYAEIGPLKRDDIYASNEKIQKFNQDLKNGLSSNVTVIPLYDKLVNEGFEMVNSTDTTHYNKETNIRIYNYLVNTVTSGVSSSSKSSVASPFTKYQLTDKQLTGLAAVGYSEQGSLEGIAAEASLMANLFELHCNGQIFGLTGGEGLYKMVSQPIGSYGGWFEGASDYINTGHTLEGEPVQEEWKAVVKSVLVDGKRTLPGYVDEHVAAKSTAYIETNGAKYYDLGQIKDRRNYISHVTIVHQKRNDPYIYYGHVADSTDPFGYTSRENREKIGDFHYDFDGNAVGNSGKQTDFYFTTNFEGLYMILSNCDWNNNVGLNLFYIICGFILTIFKAVLHYLLYFRMIILAIIIAITPLIIIADEFMKFRGNKGMLNGWIVLYLKVLLLKPLLQVVYTVLGKTNPWSVQENPFYIMLIVLVLIAVCIIYIKNLFKFSTKKEQ